MTTIRIEVSNDLYFKAKDLAIRKHLTMIKFVTQAIEEKIKSEETQMQSIKSNDIQKQPIQSTESIL